MSLISLKKIKTAKTALKKKKVFSVGHVVSLLGCSTPTVRLKLKQWKAYTSYNHNGQYYTLPDVPRFDENGLWRYQDVYFSRYGTLKNTVIHLIGASLGGLTGFELGAIVGISPRSFLHHFREVSGIRREKHDGVYVYFSDDGDRYKQQVTNRLEASLPGEHISDADAVSILVALIRHHDITIEDLVNLPEVKAKNLSCTAIAGYLKQHGLEKKTSNSKR